MRRNLVHLMRSVVEKLPLNMPERKASRQTLSIMRKASRAPSRVEVAPGPIERPPDRKAKHTFYHKDLVTIRCTPLQMQQKPQSVDQVKFGCVYADHMMEVDWDAQRGWQRPLIYPLHNVSLHPGAKVFHYAFEILEGMKAYRGVDSRIRLFRPDMNMARMRRSAARAALPDFDGEEMLKVLVEMVRLDGDWVPCSAFSSLYIRPILIGTEPTIGLTHSSTAKLLTVTSPVGAYFPTGFQPISLLADPVHVRAFPGGVGSFKMGSNYASTFRIGEMAAELGCQQVLWLLGSEEHLTEVGAMNIFIYWRDEQGENELITPPLDDGLILPGIVRDSIVTLAREWKEFRVTERYPTMAELKRAVAEKRIFQMFGSGTACAVCPIGRILYRNQREGRYEELLIPTMGSGVDVMQRFYEQIMDIQYGRVDRPDWVRLVEC